MNTKLAQFWYRRFDSGDMTLEDKSRLGRPCSVNLEDIQAAVKSNPQSSTRKLSEQLNIPTTSVFRVFKRLGALYKCCREIPHDLNSEQEKRRVDICRKLLKYPLDSRFLRQILTCDEKWIYYVTTDNRKQWLLKGMPFLPVVKQSRFQKKVMLCVWWNYECIVHFELVPQGQSITSEVYCQQLDRVYAVITLHRINQ